MGKLKEQAHLWGNSVAEDGEPEGGAAPAAGGKRKTVKWSERATKRARSEVGLAPDVEE